MMSERIFLNGAPIIGVPVGFGEPVTPPTASTTSPWTIALATSAFSVATSWVLEGITNKIRGRRR
jgi:hypothetical protein